jgi:hypothetical protein
MCALTLMAPDGIRKTAARDGMSPDRCVTDVVSRQCILLIRTV